MLTIKDTISSLILFSSPQETDLFYKYHWVEGKCRYMSTSVGQISLRSLPGRFLSTGRKDRLFEFAF